MKRMRAGEPGQLRTPALALTAFARADDRKHAILAGYQAHLAKPFDMAELAIVVAGLVGRT
jgi:CheY-like chemotaxis protein